VTVMLLLALVAGEDEAAVELYLHVTTVRAAPVDVKRKQKESPT